jgi:serine/threonine protein kinase
LVKVHQAGLLHRDLKPQNVILGPGGPKLIDFGLAVLTEREHELTETGVAVGTPAYMAPEQARGDKEPGSAIDIYGLGATLAFALTGHALYPGAKQHVLLQRIADPADLPDLTDLPRELAPLLGAMLAFDPSARPGLGAVRTRLLEVAVSGGASIGQMRDKVVQATYDSSAKLEVPPPLTDPIEDPEDTEGGEGLSVFTPEESTSTADKLSTTKRPPVDVTWLIEKLRRQYARRKTL